MGWSALTVVSTARPESARTSHLAPRASHFAPSTSHLARRTADDAAIIGKIKKAAIPISSPTPSASTKDLEPIGQFLKGVTVVGMGEPTHGTREVFQLKHRMFQYLVEKQGYTIFEIEASMAGCAAMEHYVSTGEGDPAAAVVAQGFWTWSTEEVVSLIKWIRTYNADATHTKKLHVVGVDMQDREGTVDLIRNMLVRSGVKNEFTGDLNWFPSTRYKIGLEKTFAALSQIVTEALPAVTSKLGVNQATMLTRLVRVTQQAQTLQERDVVNDDFTGARAEIMPILGEVVENAAKLRADAKDLGPDALYGFDLLQLAKDNKLGEDYDAVRLRKGVAQLKEYAAAHKERERDFANTLKVFEFLALAREFIAANKTNPRDLYMAENVKWVTDTLYPGAKAMLWAHNYHVSRGPNACGRELTRLFGERYYPIGFAFGSGSFQARSNDPESGLTAFTVDLTHAGDLDMNLHKVGLPVFFFSCATDSLAIWLNAPHTTRVLGAGYDPANASLYTQPITPAQLYRGMIYVDKTTRARPLK